VVLVGAEAVGAVSSGNFSPMLERGIALAFLRPDLGPGTEVKIDQRGSLADGSVVRLPFVTSTQSGGTTQTGKG
jgi:aminomethyltransferase